MTYVPRSPCVRCGRYERMQGGLFTTCGHCDDEALGRASQSLQERRTASGWTPAPNLYAIAYWTQPPTDYGQPGRMEWRMPKAKPYVPRPVVTIEPVDHDGSHPGCRYCDAVNEAMKRRVVR